MTARSVLYAAIWFLLAGPLVTVPARAQQPITFTTDPVVGVAGATVQIPIRVAHVDGGSVTSFQLALSYDEAHLDFREGSFVQTGTATASAWTVLDYAGNPGAYSIGGYTASDPATGEPITSDTLVVILQATLGREGAADLAIEVSAPTGAAFAPATVTVTVVTANGPPTAADDAVTTAEDAAVMIDVLANDADPDGDNLSLGIVTAPAHGTAVVTESGIAYTPSPDFAGGDTFVYAATDAAGASAEATVRVTVTAVNDAPRFSADPAIAAPAPGARILVGGMLEQPADPAQPLVVEWAAAEDAEGDEVRYTWQLAATETFAAPLFSVEAGQETQVSLALGEVARLLDAAGVALGDSVQIYHRVLASDGALEAATDVYSLVLVRGTITAAETGDVPGDYALEGNYPNPFNPRTTIAYALPEAAHVTVRVFDVAGKEVAMLVGARQPAGKHTVSFDARGLPSGLYLYHIEAGAFRATRSMTLLK